MSGEYQYFMFVRNLYVVDGGGGGAQRGMRWNNRRKSNVLSFPNSVIKQKKKNVI